MERVEMAARIDSSTSSNTDQVSDKTAEKSPVARKKAAAVAESKVATNRNAVAAKQKTAVKDSPVPVKTGGEKKEQPESRRQLPPPRSFGKN
jgi:hypothetical protein